MACGRGTAKIGNTEVPKAPDAKVETRQPALGQKYVVKEGDSLWDIARQRGVYSDSFQRPLIFKGDRDQIQAPGQITPGRVLLIQQKRSDGQITHARQLASDTPAFVAHEKPRATLPLNYF